MSSSALEPGTPAVAVGAVVVVSAELTPPGSATAIVLVRRARPPMPGRWSLPGGRLMRGETLAQGVAREVLEETGLVVQVGPLVEVFEVIDASYHYVILDYLCRHVGGELRAGDDAAEVTVASIAPPGAPDASLPPPPGLTGYGVSEAVMRVVGKAAGLLDAGVPW